ncbi:MAG: VOC family protein [Trueperaceae bacterium]
MNDEPIPAGIPPPDYRTPAATRLGDVRLQVADLERSLDWYERVLGLRVVTADVAEALPACGLRRPAQRRVVGGHRGDRCERALHLVAGAAPRALTSRLEAPVCYARATPS